MNRTYSTTVNTTDANWDNNHGITSRKNNAACPITPASRIWSRIRSPNWPPSPATSKDICEDTPCIRNCVTRLNMPMNRPAFCTAMNTNAILNMVPATIFAPRSRSASMRVELRASSNVNMTASTTDVRGLTATPCTFTANW